VFEVTIALAFLVVASIAGLTLWPEPLNRSPRLTSIVVAGYGMLAPGDVLEISHERSDGHSFGRRHVRVHTVTGNTITIESIAHGDDDLYLGIV
jgi:hypothetical protein